MARPKKPKGFRLQVLVTHNCNARCDHCDKGVGYVKLDKFRMTAAKMKEAVDALIEQEIHIQWITFSGGEPVLSPELQGIINESARLLGLTRGRVLTNDMPIAEAKRQKIVFPDDRYEWIRAPLDNPEDPHSGKNDHRDRFAGIGRQHFPFWISPADVGLEATFEKCTVRNWCGRGLTEDGFSMCGQAPVIGEMLGIDPSAYTDDIYEHTNTAMKEICKHCQYGLSRRDQKKIWHMVREEGRDAISETFEKVFDPESRSTKNLYQIKV
jgi:hypothetical protein